MIRVSARHNLTCTLEDGRRLEVRFSYDKRNPYSAYFTFLVPNQRPVNWEMARDLIAFGIGAPAGELDARLTPLGDAVEMVLSSPDCPAVAFMFKRVALLAALEKSYELVPLGAESEHVDWSDVDRFFPGVRVP